MNRLTRYIQVLLLSLIVGATETFAQPYCLARTFSIRDGLAANMISGMTQTPDGLMWYATYNGLCCYDGYTFSTYRGRNGDLPLSTNRLRMVVANSSGDVWCLTHDDVLYLFDTRECRFINMSKVLKEKFKVDVKPRNLYALNNGHTWLTCDQSCRSAFRFSDSAHSHPDSIEYFPLGNQRFLGQRVNKVREDHVGREVVFTEKDVTVLGGDIHAVGSYEYHISTPRHLYLATRDGHVTQWDGKRSPQDITPDGIGEITSMEQLDTRSFVIGTDQGVLTYDMARKAYAPLSPVGAGKAVKEMHVDSRQRVWAFGDYPGVLLVDTKTQETRWLSPPSPTLTATTADNPVWHEDAHHTVWLIPRDGTFGYYDEEHGLLKSYPLATTSYGFANIPSVSLYKVDQQHNLWLTSIHDLSLINFKYRHIQHIPLQANQETRAMLCDSKGRTWVGDGSGCIGVYDGDGHLQGYLNNAGLLQSAKTQLEGRVYALYEDRSGKVWIGTKGNGLYCLSRPGSMQHYRHDAHDSRSLSNDDIYDIDQDAHGHIWIATLGGGVDLLSDDGGEVHFIHPGHRLSQYPKDRHQKVRRITHTETGEVILSTTDGIVAFSDRFKRPEDIRFTTHSRVEGDSASLLTSDVMQTLVTHDGHVYIATMGGGLQEKASGTLIDGKMRLRTLEQFSVSEGIVQSLIEDADGSLWVVRESTLDHYDPKTGHYEQYGTNDFGERVEFTEARPMSHSGSGRLALGTMGGFLTFVPRELKKSDYSPRIIFTSVHYQGDTQPQPILNTQELSVAGNRRNLTIHFSALDYNDNHQIRYAYMLEGVDKEWNYVGESHSATFNYLPAGEHRLLVRSTNSEGVWADNQQALLLKIAPKFGETIWAKLLSVALLALLVGAILWVYRIRQRQAMQHKMNEMKNAFYVDVSHKIRTPLTLIGGPVTEVLSSDALTQRSRELLEMVRRNSHKMLQLVNKMLEYGETGDDYVVDDTTAPTFAVAQQEEAGAATGRSKDTRLLVVEDTDDLRSFLTTILSIDYSVTEAPNGRIGLEKTLSELPDFIITDVMMPEMDGMEMIAEIKKNTDTCHIPIIVLSAKASLEDRIEGLRLGIDDYISKPFSATYLRQRIDNIIQQRKMLQQRYMEHISHEDDDSPRKEYRMETPEIPNPDQEMMEALMKYLDAHLDDADMKVEDMASAVNLGRNVFYRKIKSIVGVTPVDFLRKVRMQRAEALVSKSTLTFSQIAYTVGFSDPKYFAKCFKKETGLSPSEYRQKSASGADRAE